MAIPCPGFLPRPSRHGLAALKTDKAAKPPRRHRCPFPGGVLFSAAVMLPSLLIAEPVFAQQKLPLRSVPLSRSADAIVSGGSALRPGAKGAAQRRAALASANALISRRPKLNGIVTAMTAPAIRQVNGKTSGVFEPGGDYEITGRGFGPRSGSIFLRVGGRVINLVVIHWSDGQIFAHVPDDISGLQDMDSIKLDVGPLGAPVLTSHRFGFRAAREDVALKITGAMFSSDPNVISVPGIPSVSAPAAPDKQEFDGEYLSVSREVFDRKGQKRCIPPNADHIRWTGRLRPGFEVTGRTWYHRSEQPSADGYDTPRGKYALTWEPEGIRIDYGVTRHYNPNEGSVSVGGVRVSGGLGKCTSTYRIKLIVTGPRGLPAT